MCQYTVLRNNVFLFDYEDFDWLLRLSNDVKLNSLRERINDVARNEKIGLRILSTGVILVNVGLIMSVMKNNIVAYVAGIFGVVLGIISIGFGFYVTVNFARKYNVLLEEVSTLTETKQ